MKKYKKIIFVCEDNTCRSVMAEAIMNGFKNSLKGGQELTVVSRGLVVLFPEPMNPKAVAILKSRQLEPSHAHSIPLLEEDLTEETLVIAMTEAECLSVAEKFGTVADITTVRGFVGQSGDLEEPHGSLPDYGMFFEHLDLLVKMVAQALLKEIGEELSEEEDSEVPAGEAETGEAGSGEEESPEEPSEEGEAGRELTDGNETVEEPSGGMEADRELSDERKADRKLSK